MGEDRRAGCAPPAWRATCGARASASSGTSIPACSTCTRTSRRVHAQVGAHVEVLEIDDLGTRVARGHATTRWPPRRRRSAPCSPSPTRRRTRSPARSSDEQLDWSARVAVGLDRLVGRLRARRADLLLPRRRRQRGRAARRGRDRRQLAADRARRPDRRRGRPQDEPGPAHPRPARRGRLLHGVLRARLRGGLRAHGPRRARARGDRPGAAHAARAQALPRQARRGPERRVQGPLRPGDHRRLHADGRRDGSS